MNQSKQNNNTMNPKQSHSSLPSHPLTTTGVQRLSIFDRQYPVSRAKSPVAPIVLQNLPKVAIRDQETNSSCNSTAKDCIICNEAISTTAVRLPCSHVYHPHCITQWLKDHDTCPMCRFSMPTLCHFTTPRAQLPPPPKNMTLRPPVFQRSRLQHQTRSELQDMYRSWVICTYQHQQLPINLPSDVASDRDALISCLAECGAIQIIPESGYSTTLEQ